MMSMCVFLFMKSGVATPRKTKSLSYGFSVLSLEGLPSSASGATNICEPRNETLATSYLHTIEVCS